MIEPACSDLRELGCAACVAVFAGFVIGYAASSLRRPRVVNAVPMVADHAVELQINQ